MSDEAVVVSRKAVDGLNAKVAEQAADIRALIKS
jgi:hypothetical protein